MRILGIETSGLQGSVALWSDGAIHERSLATEGRRHAQTLVLEIRELMAVAGVGPRDIDAIAVSIGPGSFTGLRVGIVCAKTWAYVTGCKLIAVDSLQLIAQQAPDEVSRLSVISDAQRGDYFLGEYRRTSPNRWERLSDVTIVNGAAWLESLTEDVTVAGPGVARIKTQPRCRIARDPWSLQPTAAAAARVGAIASAAGTFADPWTLSPLYIRPSAAEEKRALESSGH